MVLDVTCASCGGWFTRAGWALRLVEHASDCASDHGLGCTCSPRVRHGSGPCAGPGRIA